MKKTIEIGEQDFARLRENRYFYIDKTGFIREWWESGDSVTLITRPRRFGKTLNMSMLDCFFSNKHSDKGKLFEGLEIWQEEKKAASAATSSTTAPATTQPPSSYTDENVPFATAVPAASPADYQTQWDQGFLVAIDNPDPSYSCPHVSLTDDDRDLLERLCMGEFGSGGFIGAALIAQCVKDAMCFDGYATVADVIQYCRYDGSTDIGTNDACRQAVRYVFDDNCDAVQHRIMYMYNPYMVKSAFHESQNFILSYQGVRFFDRWGY